MPPPLNHLPHITPPRMPPTRKPRPTSRQHNRLLVAPPHVAARVPRAQPEEPLALPPTPSLSAGVVVAELDRVVDGHLPRLHRGRVEPEPLARWGGALVEGAVVEGVDFGFAAFADLAEVRGAVVRARVDWVFASPLRSVAPA